jgi:hypothetical protein
MTHVLRGAIIAMDIYVVIRLAKFVTRTVLNTISRTLSDHSAYQNPPMILIHDTYRTDLKKSSLACVKSVSTNRPNQSMTFVERIWVVSFVAKLFAKFQIVLLAVQTQLFQFILSY